MYHRAQPPSTFQTQSRPHADDCSHLSTDNSSLVGRFYKTAVLTGQPWQLVVVWHHRVPSAGESPRVSSQHLSPAGGLNVICYSEERMQRG